MKLTLGSRSAWLTGVRLVFRWNLYCRCGLDGWIGEVTGIGV